VNSTAEYEAGAVPVGPNAELNEKANGTSFRADDDRWPDLAANIRFDTSRGHYTLAGLVRELRVDSASDPASRSEKVGWGVGFNSVLNGIGKDDVRFAAYYGNALGRYTVGFFADALVNSDGTLDLANEWTISAAYRHYWTQALRSTLALSALRAALPAGAASATNKSAQSAHLNLIWSTVAQANIGLEYLFARREIADRSTCTLNRLQVSTQYLSSDVLSPTLPAPQRGTARGWVLR
jgi:hypothetical protein